MINSAETSKLLSVTADLPFGGAGNRELLEIKLMLLLASFVFAYFKFTWSLRQFNLLSILVGAAPMGQAGEPGIDTYARRVAGTNNLAGDDFKIIDLRLQKGQFFAQIEMMRALDVIGQLGQGHG
mgnify:CR=1 FL=1